MFELLAGDIFELDGNLLTIARLRVGVVGERVNTFVHYTYQNEVKIRPAPEFCAWLTEGLADGSVKNVNREADFR